MLRLKQLNIRISGREYEILRQMAFDSRKTISELIRELIGKEEEARKAKGFQEACAFGKKFAKKRGISEKQVIDAIMESRYGNSWEKELP